MDVVRAYLDGVEINKVPELADVCAMDNWLDGLLDWAIKNRPDMKMDAIFTADAQCLLLREVWIGEAPPTRAMEMGGVLQSFTKRVEKKI